MTDMPKAEVMQKWFHHWMSSPGLKHQHIFLDAEYDRDTIFKENGYDEEQFIKLCSYCITLDSQKNINTDTYKQRPYIHFAMRINNYKSILAMEKYAIEIGIMEKLVKDDYDKIGVKLINLSHIKVRKEDVERYISCGVHKGEDWYQPTIGVHQIQKSLWETNMR